MKWDGSKLQDAMTAFLLELLEKRNIAEYRFILDSGISSDKSGKIMRKAKNAKNARRWTVLDLGKIANFLKTNPSNLLDEIEQFYSSRSADQIRWIIDVKHRKK